MKPIIAIPAILALVHRAYSRKSLTPLGITSAFLTAIAHAVHPWSAPFFLLAVFYLAGTKATKVNHAVKSNLTLSATGAEGGEGQRTHTQVLANSINASLLSLVHAWLLAKKGNGDDDVSNGRCFSFGGDALDLLFVGIVANYAAVAADTFSSELGILSNSKPRLITSPTFRVVPPGTNGGVTVTGLLAGVLGAFTIALSSAVLMPVCQGGGSSYDNIKSRVQWVLAMTVWGALGSILDSVVGGIFQASVVDKRTGKVVEGSGGRKVLVHPSSSLPGTLDNVGTASSGAKGDARLRSSESVANTVAMKPTAETQMGRSHDHAHESRRVDTGRDWLDNNAVNVLMASAMSLGGIGVAGWLWDVPVAGIFS